MNKRYRCHKCKKNFSSGFQLGQHFRKAPSHRTAKQQARATGDNANRGKVRALPTTSAVAKTMARVAYRFCPHCGTGRKPAWKFCAGCGQAQPRSA